MIDKGDIPMGTKENPGKYDCHDKALPDEPLFTLLARDPLAPTIVRIRAELRATIKGDCDDKVHEALACSQAMRYWKKHNPEV